MAEARWYIVHAYSNFEKKVASAIMEQAERKQLNELIEDIQVPTEEVVEVARGKKKTVEKRFFPGYVLLKAQLTDDVYHLVKDTPKVSGFLGADGGKRPLPVPQREVDRILGTTEEGETTERVRPAIIFEIGQPVRVNEGPFQGFEGEVEEVDEENARLKVTVSIFGRATPVDLEYEQVEKLS
ncbi:MAG: transcription termination/antitermination protein NusG [Pseudomonadota bacterium]